jgi:uncharacterized protein YceK
MTWLDTFRRGSLALVLLVMLLALSACGTITGLARGPEDAPFTGWPVYCGVRYTFVDPGKVYGSEYWKAGLFAWIIIAIDTTISAVVDTAFLPFTIPWALVR